MSKNFDDAERGHAAADVSTPQARVRSHYRGRLPSQIEREHEDIDQEDPMLFEEKGLHPFAIALGLAAAVFIIVGLVWLFTPQVPSSLTTGSTSNDSDLESLSAQGEKSSEKVPASLPKGEAAANGSRRGGGWKLVGVVSGFLNPNDSSVDALERRPRHDEGYHEGGGCRRREFAFR